LLSAMIFPPQMAFAMKLLSSDSKLAQRLGIRGAWPFGRLDAREPSDVPRETTTAFGTSTNIGHIEAVCYNSN
jgi:hypothetical protein